MNDVDIYLESNGGVSVEVSSLTEVEVEIAEVAAPVNVSGTIAVSNSGTQLSDAVTSLNFDANLSATYDNVTGVVTIIGQAGGVGATNLGHGTSAISVTLTSSTGTNTTIGAATTTTAGVMSAAQVINLEGALQKSGGTMTGKITLDSNPTSALHAATKQYVDALDLGEDNNLPDAPTAGSAAALYVLQVAADGTDSWADAPNSILAQNSGGALNAAIKGINFNNNLAATYDSSTGIVTVNGQSSSIASITNIGVTRSSTQVTITSSDGTDGIVQAATTSLAGVMTAADKTKLDNSDSNAINQTSADSRYLQLGGGTLTGALTLSGAPTSDLQAATKKYVDDNAGNTTNFSDDIPVQPDDSTGAAGTGTEAARDDHKHPLPADATTSASGLMSGADKTKLDSVESNATADQTAGDIRTLLGITAANLNDMVVDASFASSTLTLTQRDGTTIPLTITGMQGIQGPAGNAGESLSWGRQNGITPGTFLGIANGESGPRMGNPVREGTISEVVVTLIDDDSTLTSSGASPEAVVRFWQDDGGVAANLIGNATITLPTTTFTTRTAVAQLHDADGNEVDSLSVSTGMLVVEYESGDVTANPFFVGVTAYFAVGGTSETGGNPLTGLTLGSDNILTATLTDGTVVTGDLSALAGGITQTTADGRYLRLGGGTMTGALTLSGVPTADLHAASKSYVDTQISALDLGEDNPTDAEIADKAFSNPPSDLTIAEQAAVRSATAEVMHDNVAISGNTSMTCAEVNGKLLVFYGNLTLTDYVDKTNFVVSNPGSDNTYNITVNRSGTDYPSNVAPRTTTYFQADPTTPSGFQKRTISSPYNVPGLGVLIGGTSTTPVSFSPANIKYMIDTHVPTVLAQNNGTELDDAIKGINFNNNLTATYDSSTGIVTVNGQAGGTASITNLGHSRTATAVTITSSDGDDTVLLAATTTEAGVMTANDRSLLEASISEAGADARYLQLSGGTLTGHVTLSADPTANLHAATKQYVDGLALKLRDADSMELAVGGLKIGAGITITDEVLFGTLFGTLSVDLPTDAEIGDKAFSNPPSDLSDTEKSAVRSAIGAGVGDGTASNGNAGEALSWGHQNTVAAGHYLSIANGESDSRSGNPVREGTISSVLVAVTVNSGTLTPTGTSPEAVIKFWKDTGGVTANYVGDATINLPTSAFSTHTAPAQLHDADGNEVDELSVETGVLVAEFDAINTTTNPFFVGCTAYFAVADLPDSFSQTDADARYLQLSGGTLTGKVTADGAPTADLHLATKKYVDDNAGGSSGIVDARGETLGAPTAADDTKLALTNEGAYLVRREIDHGTSPTVGSWGQFSNAKYYGVFANDPSGLSAGDFYYNSTHYRLRIAENRTVGGVTYVGYRDMLTGDANFPSNYIGHYYSRENATNHASDEGIASGGNFVAFTGTTLETATNFTPGTSPTTRRRRVIMPTVDNIPFPYCEFWEDGQTSHRPPLSTYSNRTEAAPSSTGEHRGWVRHKFNQTTADYCTSGDLGIKAATVAQMNHANLFDTEVLSDRQGLIFPEGEYFIGAQGGMDDNYSNMSLWIIETQNGNDDVEADLPMTYQSISISPRPIIGITASNAALNARLNGAFGNRIAIPKGTTKTLTFLSGQFDTRNNAETNIRGWLTLRIWKVK